MTDTITRLIQAAEQALEALQIGQDAFGQAFGGYGYYRPDNPHNFFPDPECCTPEEIANHSAACEAYDKRTYVPNHKDGWITPEVHVTAAPWGIGTYTDECKEITDAITALTAAIEAAKQEKADQIKTAVDRFLGWKLPENFAPDCHITFDAISAIQTPNSWPIGTNLFTADQAKAMFEHCLEGTGYVVHPEAAKVREAEPYCYAYEWDTPMQGVHQQLHYSLWNGMKPHRTVPLFTTPQPQVPEWQPIETAPRDGACIVYVETDDAPWVGRLERDKKGNWIHEGEPTFCHSYYFRPTLWMPLPATPKKEG